MTISEFFSMLFKGFRAMKQDIDTPKSFKTGEEFENYVRKNIFPADQYDIIERTHGYNANKDYIESSARPDFKLRDKKTNEVFFLEAKFRTKLYQNKITWATQNQIIRYNKIQKEEGPVFIIIGMGDKPARPNYITLLPLGEAKFTGLYKSFADKYKIDENQAVKSKELWALTEVN